MNIYDSIETLPLYNWDKYLNTKDTNWFLVDFDGRQKKVDPLLDVEIKIIDEYFKALDDRSLSIKLQKWAKIDNLITKYNVVNHLLDRLSMGFADMQLDTRLLFIKELKKYGFKMSEVNSEEGDIEDILRIREESKGLKTKIKLIEMELNEESKKESMSLYKQLQIATLSLGYSYKLNPKEITLREWIEICKMLEENKK